MMAAVVIFLEKGAKRKGRHFVPYLLAGTNFFLTPPLKIQSLSSRAKKIHDGRHDDFSRNGGRVSKTKEDCHLIKQNPPTFHTAHLHTRKGRNVSITK